MENEVTSNERNQGNDEPEKNKPTVKRSKSDVNRRVDHPRSRSQRRYLEMIDKRELRKYELGEKASCLRHHLDMLECSVPAVMVSNLWRMAQGAPIENLQSVMENQFRSLETTPLDVTASRHFDSRVREAEAQRKEAERRKEEASIVWAEKQVNLENITRELNDAKKQHSEKLEALEKLTREASKLREAGSNLGGSCGCNDRSRENLEAGKTDSVDSITSNELECLAKLEEMAKTEIAIKKQIAELERREIAYMKALQQADELWSKSQGDEVANHPAVAEVSDLKRELRAKNELNQQLSNEVTRLEDQLLATRIELQKYTGIEVRDMGTGGRDDYARVSEKAVAVKPRVRSTAAGGKIDTAESGMLAKPEYKETGTEGRICERSDANVAADFRADRVDAAVAMDPQIISYEEIERRKLLQAYLNTLDSLSELYRDDEFECSSDICPRVRASSYSIEQKEMEIDASTQNRVSMPQDEVDSWYHLIVSIYSSLQKCPECSDAILDVQALMGQIEMHVGSTAIELLSKACGTIDKEIDLEEIEKEKKVPSRIEEEILADGATEATKAETRVITRETEQEKDETVEVEAKAEEEIMQSHVDEGKIPESEIRKDSLLEAVANVKEGSSRDEKIAEAEEFEGISIAITKTIERKVSDWKEPVTEDNEALLEDKIAAGVSRSGVSLRNKEGTLPSDESTEDESTQPTLENEGELCDSRNTTREEEIKRDTDQLEVIIQQVNELEGETCEESERKNKNFDTNGERRDERSGEEEDEKHFDVSGYVEKDDKETESKDELEQKLSETQEAEGTQGYFESYRIKDDEVRDVTVDVKSAIQIEEGAQTDRPELLEKGIIAQEDTVEAGTEPIIIDGKIAEYISEMINEILDYVLIKKTTIDVDKLSVEIINKLIDDVHDKILQDIKLDGKEILAKETVIVKSFEEKCVGTPIETPPVPRKIEEKRYVPIDPRLVAKPYLAVAKIEKPDRKICRKCGRIVSKKTRCPCDDSNYKERKRTIGAFGQFRTSDSSVSDKRAGACPCSSVDERRVSYAARQRGHEKQPRRPKDDIATIDRGFRRGVETSSHGKKTKCTCCTLADKTSCATRTNLNGRSDSESSTGKMINVDDDDVRRTSIKDPNER